MLSKGAQSLQDWVDFTQPCVNAEDPDTQLEKILQVLSTHDQLKPPPKHIYLKKGERSLGPWAYSKSTH